MMKITNPNQGVTTTGKNIIAMNSVFTYLFKIIYSQCVILKPLLVLCF